MRAAPAIFDAHLVAAEQSLAAAVELLAQARAIRAASGFDDPGALAELMRDAERLTFRAQSEAFEAGNVAEQARCEREDARYEAFRRGGVDKAVAFIRDSLAQPLNGFGGLA